MVGYLKTQDYHWEFGKSCKLSESSGAQLPTASREKSQLEGSPLLGWRELSLGQWVFRGQRTAVTWGVAGTHKGKPRDPQLSSWTFGELPVDLVGNSYRGCLWIRKQFLGELVKS